MLVDWFTFAVQALNFIILIFLMKRFLYRPILEAIEAREKHIAAELKNADDKNEQAQKMLLEYQNKNDKFDQSRVLLIDQMNEEIKAEHKRRFEEINQEANALKLKRQESLESSTQKFYESIQQKTEMEVFEVARKVLSDLSTTTLENSICQKFILRLEAMSLAEKEQLTQSLKADTAVLRTSFNLSDKDRSLMQDFMNDFFKAKISLQFETSSQLIAGIELASNGSKISWSIGDFLNNIEQSLSKEISSEH